ncbi:MAG: N-6 DNA methylase [Turicibacter sp.]|nr:N-6 DNA methylase [Turicibacter sp.]
MERTDYSQETQADINASLRFTRLYDEIIKQNHGIEPHALNVFLIRLLFMLFSEDSGIMEKGIFTQAIKTRTVEDGSNLNAVIKDIFEVLDVPASQRSNEVEWLQHFPYVNGKLFREPHTDMVFDKTVRKLILEAGELLKWEEINPDILGSMIQNVANGEQRASQGMHYTSVPDIMKLIGPLFLDGVTEVYRNISDKFTENESKDIQEETRRGNRKKYVEELKGLRERLSKIKFLDPACGSGNFLIISYKELRRLEIKILKLIADIENNIQRDLFEKSVIPLSHFFGIEIENFAHEVARLSLWIAEHQMNLEMMETLACHAPALLPLRDEGNIVNANALRVDWHDVFDISESEEAYILGNPPYLGSRNQSEEQKNELELVLKNNAISRKVDYITGWIFKGAEMLVEKNLKLAFVTTNSIFQGEQVSLIWETILKKDIAIEFAYTSFKWRNNAKNNAGVTVAIIGLASMRNISTNLKIIDENLNEIQVSKITPYLTEGNTVFVNKSRKNKSMPYLIQKGNAEYADNQLSLSREEAVAYKEKFPDSAKFIRKFIDSKDLLNSTHKYVLWIEDKDVDYAKEFSYINSRLQKIKEFRSKSKRAGTKRLADTPWKFGEVRWKNQEAVVLPVISSEGRDYLSATFVDKDTIPSYATFVIYDAPLWVLGLISSKIHMVWLRSIGGKLKTDYRYSAGLVYNTFPVPPLSTQRKNMMEEQILEILDLREEIGGTLAELYNNSTMPAELREAHEKLDQIVERAYQDRPFTNDNERLSKLLNMYQDMTKGE